MLTVVVMLGTIGTRSQATAPLGVAWFLTSTTQKVVMAMSFMIGEVRKTSLLMIFLLRLRVRENTEESFLNGQLDQAPGPGRASHG